MVEENLKQKEGFEYYYSLGYKRSCSKVAVHLQVSERTIYNWSSKYNWQEKVKHRDIINAKKLEEKTDDTIIDVKSKYLTIINEIVEVFKTKLNDGNIRINSVKDLEQLAKLELLLREGELPSEDKIVNIIIEKDDQTNKNG